MISDRLDEHPELYDMAVDDLVGHRSRNTGRDGLTGEQALRIGMLKQIHGLSYERLAFHLEDSRSFMRFARLPLGKRVTLGVLKANVKRISPATWEAVSGALVEDAIDLGFERADKIRTDCTPVESNIHPPTDSSLLYDCVRVLARGLNKARRLAPGLVTEFQDHTRRAKKRAFEIQFLPKPEGEKRPRGKVADAKKKQRKKAYKDLVKVTEATRDYAEVAVVLMATAQCADVMVALQLEGIRLDLETFLERTKRVIDQTRRRVFNGEKVPAGEKILSIFEPHTDIIIKDRRDITYGHKVCLTTGASNLVIDCFVEDGNPADSTLVGRTVGRVKAALPRMPTSAVFDGGFASRENLKLAKEAGLEHVVFHKKCGLTVEEMAGTKAVFRKLRNFRAGIEGCISALKRGFRMARCTWRSLRGFESFVRLSVASFNAILLARHILAKSAG